MLALDTETTGVDLHHGARPFLVTTCTDAGDLTYWEWPVDPLTRQPQIPDGDLEEIAALLAADDGPVVFQNGKFDVAALDTVGLWELYPLERLWPRVQDTLYAGHLLASNQPHNLTDMATMWLGKSIQPYEDRLRAACNTARRLARKEFPAWRIAAAGLPEMPSAKSGSQKDKKGVESESPWKFDCWLPKALAAELEYPSDHEWWTVTEEYANQDSVTTLQLWQWMEPELKARDLWEIYLERIKLIPVIYEMEQHGVTASKANLDELRTQFRAESAQAAGRMRQIAKRLKYDLEVPRGGNNKSLREFCFGLWDKETKTYTRQWLDLPAVKRSGKTGEPSLDKEVIEEYEATLPPGPALDFVRALQGKRKRDTAISYMDSYERFWIPLKALQRGDEWLPTGIYNDRGEQLWYRLFPSLNATGTDTLRFSCSNPNGQNISKKEDFNVRACFGPAPGREWWAIDFENIELRIPAYESGEREMIELFERPDDPPYYGSKHLLIFDTLHPDKFAKHGRDCKKVYEPTWYKWTKNGNFATQYGCQEKKADATYHVPGAYRRIQGRFAKQAALNARVVQFAERHGYVETLPDRTICPRRGYPLLCTRAEYGKIKPTVPLAYRVQGTAMWCTAKAMVRCHTRLREWTAADPRGYRMPLQVHDEIVFDFPAAGAANLPKALELRRLMEQSGDDVGVPLKVAVSYHPRNWAVSENPLKYGATSCT